MSTADTCPRCGEHFYTIPPGVSRASDERDIEICSFCCGDEAVGRGVVAVSAWPIGPEGAL